MNCKICFENFDLNEHKPMVMIPCGHTVCQKCLERIKQQTLDVCPTCRIQITLDRPNYALIDLVNPIVSKMEQTLFSPTVPVSTAEQDNIRKAFSYDELTNLLSVVNFKV